MVDLQASQLLSLSARTGAEAQLRLRHGLNKPFVLLCARCSRQCARHWPVQAGTRAQKAEGLQTSLALEPRARGQVALKTFLASARVGMLPRCAPCRHATLLLSSALR